jgi:hypothetical protein
MFFMSVPFDAFTNEGPAPSWGDQARDYTTVSVVVKHHLLTLTAWLIEIDSNAPAFPSRFYRLASP